jgi:hypothetical protein
VSGNAAQDDHVGQNVDHIDLARHLLGLPPAGTPRATDGVDITVATNSSRNIRGRSILLTILDECAFYRDEASATPDKETYNAIMPGMATLLGSLLVGISSAYHRSGLLYERWHDCYGRNDDNVLVTLATSMQLNPTLDRRIIHEALER